MITAVFKGDLEEDAIEWCREQWKRCKDPFYAVVRDNLMSEVFNYKN
jgi:hypothetical protein